MGALPLPKSEMVVIARASRDAGEREITEVSRRYLVSRQAVSLRFEQLRMTAPRGQVEWAF